jgi:hypothetical protein
MKSKTAKDLLDDLQKAQVITESCKIQILKAIELEKEEAIKKAINK